jgi:hypothetical protein
MVVAGIILLLAVVGFGILFLRLHSLPERIAHKRQKLQLEVVAILCLIALFTHIHLFWMAALLLAVVELPDFSGLLGRMAAALERMAGRRGRDPAADASIPRERVEAQPPSAGADAASAAMPVVDAQDGKAVIHA